MTNNDANMNEAGHYVVTAQPAGSVIQSVKCSFLAPGSTDIVIAKSHHLEVRQLIDTTITTNSNSSEATTTTNNNNDDNDVTNLDLPVALSAPINGRITNILPFRHPSSPTDYLFFITETKQYAVVSYSKSTTINNSPYNLTTHVSGDLSDYGLAIRGNEPEGGPVAALDPCYKCIALHLYEGFITILPIHKSYTTTTSSNPRASASASSNASSNVWEFLGPPFHSRIEERDVYSMTFLIPKPGNEDKIMPQVALLHQDSRGNQHVIAHSVDLMEKSLVMHGLVSPVSSSSSVNMSKVVAPLVQHRLKKSRVDGSSGLIIPVPPMGWGKENSKMPSASTSTSTMMDENSSPTGGMVILGQKQITYHDTALNLTKILPIANFITTSFVHVHPLPLDKSGSNQQQDQDVVRYLLGDEDGKMHILAVVRNMEGNVTGLHLDTLGVTNISSSLVYLEKGLVFVGSHTADSQLIQILDEAVPVGNGTGDGSDSLGALVDGKNVTYINVLEEYTNLGPIVDFDLVPTCHNSLGLSNNHSNVNSNRQVMAVTASGTEKDGTIRLVRNGIGMTEHAAVELGGIKGMWNVRKSFWDVDDSYLIQSYVGETRILGVVSDDEDEVIEDVDDDEESEGGGATLAEVNITGIDAATSTLFVGNVCVDDCGDSSLMVQITQRQIRLISADASKCLVTWEPEKNGLITVASANDAGQIVVALRGGDLVYLQIVNENEQCNFQRSSHCNLGKEISCIDLNPFESRMSIPNSESEAAPMDMDIDKSETTSVKSIVKSKIVAVGLWDDSSVHLLSLNNSTNSLESVLHIDMASEDSKNNEMTENSARQMMARSLCLVTLDASNVSMNRQREQTENGRGGDKLDMLMIGLGDGSLMSFVVKENKFEGGEGDTSKWSVGSRKEVNIGTRALNLVPFDNRAADKGTCVLATGDRPTVVYLSGGGSGSTKNARLCYSNIHISTNVDDNEEDVSSSTTLNDPLVVNIASPFHSSLLFDTPYTSATGKEGYYSLCISDDSMLRLGMIDDIQKLHVTSHKLGMPPRRVTYDESSRLVCVGCIEGGATYNGDTSNRGDINMGNCVKFFDATSFEEIDCFHLGPYEMIMSMISTKMKVTGEVSKSSEEKGDQDSRQPFLIIGTAYGMPGENEPSRGRIIVLKCTSGNDKSALSRKVQRVAEVQVKGGVFSICPFYDGSILATINSKTRMCKLVGDSGLIDLKIIGAGHHGHIMSLFVRSMSDENEGLPDSAKRDQLAIIGDMVRSISVVKYYPEYETLEEIARDFNQNWVTAVEMLTSDIYLGAENFHNIFALRRNPNSPSEEVRCRLDTVGLYNLGEMINKFMRGSLVMANNSCAASMNNNPIETISNDSMDDQNKGESHRLSLGIGSQTLYATVDGSIGSVIGLDARTASFFLALQRSMNRVIVPVGKLKHDAFRSYRGQRKHQSCRGFVDGDLIESFCELDLALMEAIVADMNKDGRWAKPSTSNKAKRGTVRNETRKDLTVGDVIAMVEDMSMAH